MYQNFSSFLTNSLRILNIANRVIPLVRDINPQIAKVRETIKRINTTVPTKILPSIEKFPQQRPISSNNNNNLTFFR